MKATKYSKIINNNMWSSLLKVLEMFRKYFVNIWPYIEISLNTLRNTLNYKCKIRSHLSVFLKWARVPLCDGTPSEIALYVLRNHCTKFGALVCSVTIKTIRHQTRKALIRDEESNSDQRFNILIVDQLWKFLSWLWILITNIG